MKSMYRILVFCLFAAACAHGQMTVISAPSQDPDVKPEQLTATIVHYQKMRLTARRTIHVLALALENTEGPRTRLNEAINNEQDIVDWANWCIQALRDKSDEGVACAFPPGLTDGASSAGNEGVCQVAQNPRVRAACSQQPASVKAESPDSVQTSRLHAKPAPPNLTN